MLAANNASPDFLEINKRENFNWDYNNKHFTCNGTESYQVFIPCEGDLSICIENASFFGDKYDVSGIGVISIINSYNRMSIFQSVHNVPMSVVCARIPSSGVPGFYTVNILNTRGSSIDINIYITLTQKGRHYRQVWNNWYWPTSEAFPEPHLYDPIRVDLITRECVIKSVDSDYDANDITPLAKADQYQYHILGFPHNIPLGGTAPNISYQNKEIEKPAKDVPSHLSHSLFATEGHCDPVSASVLFEDEPTGYYTLNKYDNSRKKSNIVTFNAADIKGLFACAYDKFYPETPGDSGSVWFSDTSRKVYSLFEDYLLHHHADRGLIMNIGTISAPHNVAISGYDSDISYNYRGGDTRVEYNVTVYFYDCNEPYNSPCIMYDQAKRIGQFNPNFKNVQRSNDYSFFHGL